VRPQRIRAALWSALFVPGLAWAQSSPPVGPPSPPGAASAAATQSHQARKAQAYVDLAASFFQEKSYAEALAELRKAEPLLAGDPAQAAVRFNIARCLEEMKRPGEALAAYGLYLVSDDQGPKRARAEAAVTKLKAEHFGRLGLTCLPEGAMVTLEGGPEGLKEERRCPVSAELPAGQYAAWIRAAGHDERRIELVLSVGQARVERVELRKFAPMAPEPAAGASRPAPAPVRAAAVEAPVQPAPAEGGRGPWPWVALGTGGLALVGGGVLHVMMAGARDDAAKTAPGSAARADKTDTFETLRTGALVGYGVGAAVTGVGVWLLLRAPATGTTARVVPAPGGLEVRF